MTQLLTAMSPEELERELRLLSSRITDTRKQVTDDQSRFQSITAELRVRGEMGLVADPEPKPLTKEELLQQQLQAAQASNRALINKLISMESEQAKLVIEVEAAKYAKREAEERLALVAKYHTPENPS